MSIHHRVVIALIVVAHTGLVGYCAYRYSPTSHEIGALPAGISHWTLGRFDLARDTPPLVRLVAAIPALLHGVRIDWRHYDDFAQGPSTMLVARDFVEGNSDDVLFLFTLSRWACLPFSWLGAFFCYRWATVMFGMRAGVLALALWCVSPNVIAHSALLSPHVASAAIGMAAFYCIAQWLKAGKTHTRAIGIGVAVGCAQLADYSWLCLYVLWPVAWSAWSWKQLWKPQGGRVLVRDGPRIGIGMAVSVCVINLGYLCEGSGTRVGTYHFVSALLGGAVERPEQFRIGHHNRFTTTTVARWPLSLPKNYVQGLDLRRYAGDLRRPCYLRGSWSRDGWWQYHLYAALIKIPLGTWCMVAIALAAISRQCVGRRTLDHELLLFIPLIGFLIWISMDSSTHGHSRNALPAHSFLFVAASRVAAAPMQLRAMQYVLRMCMVWSIASSVWIYPHGLSYFNEVIGGPYLGPRHLLGTDVDCGQDLNYAKEWVSANAGARPLSARLHSALIETIGKKSIQLSIEAAESRWMICSVNSYYGSSEERKDLRSWEHINTIGYSLYVVRRKEVRGES